MRQGNKQPFIRHDREGLPTVGAYPHETVYSDYEYVIGKAKPNYPMPAIRHGTMLLNYKGEHRFCVVFANQWCGYATLISDVYAKD